MPALTLGIVFGAWLLLLSLVLAVLIGSCLALAWLEPRLGSTPDFSLGLFIGTITVLFTMLLNFLTLMLGTRENWQSLALLTFVAHMPIAALEGLILGFSLGFLAKVKPEMLRIEPRTMAATHESERTVCEREEVSVLPD
jgi:cobalt/nickel transport system permease protein